MKMILLIFAVNLILVGILAVLLTVAYGEASYCAYMGLSGIGLGLTICAYLRKTCSSYWSDPAPKDDKPLDYY